ncbi:MAG: threonine aldolase family protein [Phototrophicaceae bacterium]|jgi:threonine aldolase
MIPHRKQQFASDNYAGICPEALDYTLKANADHVSSYGDDPYTARVATKLRDLFEIDCEIYFVFNGTAANSLALAALAQSYNSVIAHEIAHIETDECGAPEFFSNGSKILMAQGENGKLTPASIEHLVRRRTDIHYPKPKVVSITQSTEVGTVYDREELLVIREVADKHHLYIHMDGARFANAVATLNIAPKEITWKAGVDVLCFGGTKNGLAIGEIIVFFDKQLARDFDYRCKQAGQLASKMRYLSAPWLGLLENDVWLNNARHANACAQMIYDGLQGIPNLKIQYPRQSNAVFVEMPQPLFDALHERGWHFYNFIGNASRLMCAWDTEIATVEALLADVRELTGVAVQA